VGFFAFWASPLDREKSMTATQWTGFHGLGPRGFPVEPSGTTPDLVPFQTVVYSGKKEAPHLFQFESQPKFRFKVDCKNNTTESGEGD